MRKRMVFLLDNTVIGGSLYGPFETTLEANEFGKKWIGKEEKDFSVILSLPVDEALIIVRARKD